MKRKIIYLGTSKKQTIAEHYCIDIDDPDVECFNFYSFILSFVQDSQLTVEQYLDGEMDLL